jgi:hypothetical protein
MYGYAEPITEDERPLCARLPTQCTAAKTPLK